MCILSKFISLLSLFFLLSETGLALNEYMEDDMPLECRAKIDNLCGEKTSSNCSVSDFLCFKECAMNHMEELKLIGCNRREGSRGLLIGPDWTLGLMERPQGKTDMGTWQASVYTDEQQNRLGVDKWGIKIKSEKNKETSEPASKYHTKVKSIQNLRKSEKNADYYKDEESPYSWPSEVFPIEPTPSPGRSSPQPTQYIPPGKDVPIPLHPEEDSFHMKYDPSDYEGSELFPDAATEYDDDDWASDDNYSYSVWTPSPPFKLKPKAQN